MISLKNPEQIGKMRDAGALLYEVLCRLREAVQPGMSIAEAMASLTATLSDPFALAWTDRTAKCILLFLLSYGTAMGICVSDRRNYRRREEYGSAAWSA